MAQYAYVDVLAKGNSFQYVVPNFPVYKPVLREIKLCWEDQDDGTVHYFDGFAHDTDLLDHPLPAVARLPVSFDNAFLIDEEDFSKAVDLSQYTLFCDNKIFVMWNWEWFDFDREEPSDEGSDIVVEDQGLDSLSDEEDLTNSFITHSVVFKCIGATKEHRYQELLGLAKQKLKDGHTVPVKLQKEPSNNIDSRSIAFMCKVDKDWERIGYVVSEALPDVHHAMDHNKILKIYFDWIRFKLYKTPGLYAGIIITKNGTWSRVVVQCSSASQ